MSRFRKYARSLLSGYLLLAANIFYTLASVPLALHYLTKEEFGLWALVSQLGGYILLIDFGMSGSVARILIDHKDAPSVGRYGSVIKTGALVGVIQGGIIILVGCLLSCLAGSSVGVPPHLQHEFVWLMSGQAILLGVNFASRILINLLLAHQRQDIYNQGASVFFFVNLAAMWIGLSWGWGIYAFLAASAVMNAGCVLVSFMGCLRLGLFPARNEWGTINRACFKELFSFGGDIFLYSLGTQLINASQTILLTRFFGLETAAVWNVCTRTYTVLTQVVFRMFDFSAPALAEMMVRNERQLLAQRFEQIVTLSANSAVVAGAVFACCNGAFVSLWTHGRIGWPPINDVLLAIWLVVCTAMHAHTGLVGQTKNFRFMRYIFFIEGLFFVALTIALKSFGGITSMLAVSVVCTSLLSLPYGFYRTRKYFGLRWSELAGWHRSQITLFLCVAPAGVLDWWCTHLLTPMLRLLVGGGLLMIWASGVFVCFGLTPHLKAEIFKRAPNRFRALLSRLGFGERGGIAI